jgi:hypothetical protein
MDNFPQLDWQVRNLRVTAFPGPSAQFNQEPNWWAELMGEPPETSLRQSRREILEQEDHLENGRLSLTVQPNRINWLFSAIIDEEEIAVPIIGPFEETLGIFLPLMERWLQLDTCPPLSRIAFGTILLFPVDSQQIGYQQLNELLPSITLDPEEDVSDFSYQINRPRNTITQVEDLRINRLSKWQVSTIRYASLIVGQTSTRESSAQALSACRLELDINTHQDFNSEFRSEHLLIVFNELVDLGREIARQGDVR